MHLMMLAHDLNDLHSFHNLNTGDFDGKDRRRRHENGEGKRGQVC